MPILDAGGGRVPLEMWTRGVPVEDAAMQQLRNIAALPFIHSHIAVMPDVHFGRGATVGSVIPTKGAIVPASVGVDIGCGMAALQTTLRADQLPDSLRALRLAIEAAVPVGFAVHDEPTKAAELAWCPAMARGLEKIQAKHPEIELKKHPAQQLGTLGGGNHFIEVCLDEDDAVWVMLHSGSRGIGNRIGTHFIGLAKREMEREQIHLPDRDLAYLVEHTEVFDDYVHALGWAQDYARINRDLMLDAVLTVLRAQLPPFGIVGQAVNCHHNYAVQETHFGERVWLTRKGAVRAGRGDLGIIPGSMGTRSYIVRGLGNEESFCTCSHGAGRRMSRGDAKRRITLEDHVAATAGIECRKDEGVLDESPAAYKDIDAVIAAQSDLIEVVHELRQVVCIKG